MRRFLQVVLVFCLLLVIGAGLFLWRVSQGPVSLAAVQPVLQTLIDRGSLFVTTFAAPTLVWSREEGTLALQVSDLEVRTASGDFVAGAPSARIAVAARPLLLEQRIEPVLVALNLPDLELTRNLDGELVLAFAGQLTALPLGQAAGGGGLDALMGGETAGSGGSGLEQLQRVRVSAPALQFFDEATGHRATAGDPVFELERHARGWAVSLASLLGDGWIELAAEPGATPSELLVTIDLDRFPTQDLAGIVPQLSVGDLRLPVSGQIRFPFDTSTRSPGPGQLQLTTEHATIAAPNIGLGPLPIREAGLKASLPAGWQAAEIEQLRLRGDGYALAASGSVAHAEGSLAGRVQLKADDLDAPEIMALWPAELGADARAWIAENVPAGRITQAAFELGQDSPHPGQPDLGGSFAFSGVELRWLDTMPPATALAGTGSLAGRSLGFKLSGGRAGEVELTGGDVTLLNAIGPETTQLKANLALRSTVPAAFQLLDAPPLALGKTTGLSPQAMAGRQTTRLELSLPLVPDPPPSRIRYKATTQLSDVAIRDVRPGYSVAAASLTLVADQTGLSTRGSIQVNGVPLNVNWRENLNNPRGPARRIEVAGTADAAAVRALNFTWPEQLRGAVGVTATVVEATSPLRTIDLALDLQQAELRLPEILLNKRLGQPGKASATLVQPNEQSLTVEPLRLDLPNLTAEGLVGLRLDPLRPERISLRELRGLLGDLTADLALQRDVWRGRIDVGRLDLRPVLQGGAGGGGQGPAIPDLAIQVTARQLRLGDSPFSLLTGTIERSGGTWQSASLRSRIEDSEVAFDLQTRNQVSAVTLRSNDAGWLIRGLANSDNGIRGGQFRLSADLRQARDGLRGGGELKIRDFTLYGAPLIARIVSLASFSGLTNALSGRGVPVQRLVAPFELQGDRLLLHEARLVGSDIGARADGTIDLAASRLQISGTVAPAYTVNRILGRIPIVGQILSGSRSDAALAATFSVTGPLAEPSVSVNPLAALVPGMVRDLFSALTADTSSDLAPVDQR